jgi:hypothetical protein
MGYVIQDGRGGGFQAHVGSDNHLSVNSASLSYLIVKSLGEQSFSIPCGPSTLTAGGTHGMFWIKNDRTDDSVMVIDSIVMSMGAIVPSLTAGSSIIARFHKGVMGGTLVTAGSPVTPVNRNFGSSQTAMVTVRVPSANNQTVEGGVLISTVLFQAPLQAAIFSGVGWVFPSGASLGVSLEVPVGTTSLQVTATPLIFFVDPSEF